MHPMSKDQQKIRRKLRILQHTKKAGSLSKAKRASIQLLKGTFYYHIMFPSSFLVCSYVLIECKSAGEFPIKKPQPIKGKHLIIITGHVIIKTLP